MGIYGLKRRPPNGGLLSESPPKRAVIPSGRSISTQTVVNIRTYALGDTKAPRAQAVPLVFGYNDRFLSPYHPLNQGFTVCVCVIHCRGRLLVTHPASLFPTERAQSS